MVGGEWQLEVQITATVVGCVGCGVRAEAHGRRTVRVRDLPVGGRPVVLAWPKRLWRCREPACRVRTWTERVAAIGPRAGADRTGPGRGLPAVGTDAHAVAAVARDLGVGWAAVAVQLGVGGNAGRYRRPGDLPELRPAAAHVLAATDHASRLAADPEATAGLLTRIGAYLWRRVEPGQARQLFERALAILEDRLGPDHPDTASNLDNHGLVLRRLGELPAARDAHQHALAIRQAQLGPDHFDVARSLDNLGLVLRHLGELDAAGAAHQHPGSPAGP